MPNPAAFIMNPKILAVLVVAAIVGGGYLYLTHTAATTTDASTSFPNGYVQSNLTLHAAVVTGNGTLDAITAAWNPGSATQRFAFADSDASHLGLTLDALGSCPKTLTMQVTAPAGGVHNGVSLHVQTFKNGNPYYARILQYADSGQGYAYLSQTSTDAYGAGDFIVAAPEGSTLRLEADDVGNPLNPDDPNYVQACPAAATMSVGVSQVPPAMPGTADIGIALDGSVNAPVNSSQPLHMNVEVVITLPDGTTNSRTSNFDLPQTGGSLQQYKAPASWSFGRLPLATLQQGVTKVTVHTRIHGQATGGPSLDEDKSTTLSFNVDASGHLVSKVGPLSIAWTGVLPDGSQGTITQTRYPSLALTSLSRCPPACATGSG